MALRTDLTDGTFMTGVHGEQHNEVNELALELEAAVDNLTHRVHHVAAPTGTASTDRAAIQAALDDAHTAGGGIVQLQAGTYAVDFVAHPAPGGTGFGQICLALRRGVHLRGVARDQTTIKVTGAGTMVDGVQNRIITNYNMEASGASSTWDNWLTISDLTVDGNCANVGSSAKQTHGIQMWRTSDLLVERVTVKNCRGDNAADKETFHVDALRSFRPVFRDCIVDRDDGGQTATGFSLNFSTDAQIHRCIGRNMLNGHGFTLYSSSGVAADCQAYSNNNKGFNVEYCWNLDIVNLHTGVATAATASTTSVGAYTPNQARGNIRGLHIQLTDGGGKIRVQGGASQNNTNGLTILGSKSFTTATGTTGTTIVGPSGTFTAAHVGRWIRVNSGTWVKISAFTSSTTVTTDSAHGGSVGQTAEIMSGDISVDGMDISANTTGVQFQDTGASNKRLTIQRTNLTGARIRDNTNDLVDVGNGSTVTQSRASGRVTTTLLSNWSSGTEFYNPFPMDMLVFTTGGSAATSIRGAHPLASSNSTGVNSPTFVLPAGASFTHTSTTAPSWFFMQ